MRTVGTILLLLFFSSNLWAVKVALIGDGDAVDQLTVALSRNQDIELMERAAIDKILKENKLTLNGGAELSQKFSHVDIIGVATLASVEFFNAQNGFKLARLPFKDALSSIRIQQVIEKSVVPEVHFLSIGFVNLTDIPVKERPQVARILIELENTLVNMDKIQLLERDHLAAILQERELSQTQYSLTPSSKIIRCEFNQGADADKIDLEIYVSDSRKKILFHKKYMAIDNGVFIAGEVGAALDSVSISDAGNDRKSEAKRYFEEYYSAIKRSGHRYTSVVSRTHEPLRKYVNAMYVLEPENPRYCYEKIFYELCFAASSRQSWRKKIEILQKFVRDAKEFRQKFPDFRFPGSGNAGCGFRYHPLITIQPLNNLYNYRGKAPSDVEAKELSHLNDELHEIHRAIFIQFSPYYFDDSSKIETLKDLQNYRETRRVFLDLMPHFDAEKAVRSAWKSELEIWGATWTFMQANPAQAKKALHDDWYFPYLFQIRGIWQKNEAWQTTQAILNNNIDEITTLIKKINHKQNNYHSWELIALRDYLNSDGSFEAFKKCFSGMIASFVKEEHFRPAPNAIYGHNLLGAATEYFKLDDRRVLNYILTYPYEYLFENVALTEKERAVYAIQLMKEDTPASQIRLLAFSGICENATGGRLQHFGNKLYHKADAKSKARLAELNEAFSIDSYSLPKMDEIEFCCGATLHEKMLYSLYRDKKGELRLFCFDTEKRNIVELPKPNIQARKFQQEMRGNGQSGSITLQVFGDVIFAGGQKSIAIFDRRTNGWNVLNDLPGEYITGIHWDGKRIYYLCGGDPTDSTLRHLSMHSCNIGGSERKTYFNGKTGKSLFEATGSGTISGFIPIADGRLLFTLAPINQRGHLVAFDLASEKFESLQTFPVSGAVFSLRQNGDFLLGQDGTYFGCSFFKLDTENPKSEVELLLTQHAGDRRKFRYRINGYHAIQHPAVLVKNRYLVNAGHGYGNWFLDLHQPKKSPLLLLPTCVSVFYLPERDEFIYPGFYNPNLDIYAVKLKEDYK